MAKKVKYRLTEQEKQIKKEIAEVTKAGSVVMSYISCKVSGVPGVITTRLDEVADRIIEAIKRRDGIEGEIRIA